MRTTFINAGLLLCATALAVAPVLGMRWTLRAQATHQAEAQLEGAAHRTLSHVDGVLAEASDVLASVAEIATLPCGSAERSRLSSAAFEARSIKSILIIGPDGRTLCSSSEIPANSLLGLRFREARQKGLSVGINPSGDGGRVNFNVRVVVAERILVANIILDLLHLDYTPSEWQSSASGVLAFDDNTLITRLPVWSERIAATGAPETLTSTALSERFPVRVTINVPVEVATSSSRLLAIIVDIGGGLLGVLFFLLIAQAAWRKPTVEDAIARGVRRDEFIPYYQPVFNIQDGALVGCEVLIRWRKDDGTIVPPGAFIREAEESGLAVEMTHRLMCKVRDEIGEIYASNPDLKLAINLFAGHFFDFTIVDDVRQIFSTGGVRYSQLVFEVTERYPLPNLARAKLAIKGLQELGCRVALDDAGTGHGGLAYLQMLGMDQLKIDKLFVDTITTTTTGSPIIDSLIELGRSLSMEIVAEGVESREQIQYLKSRGVHFAQGYLFAKPLAGPMFIAMIAASHHRDAAAHALPAPDQARAA